MRRLNLSCDVPALGSHMRRIELDGSILRAVVDNIANTEIRPSTLHGNGLFAMTDIPPSVLLAVLDGQRITWDSLSLMLASQIYGQFSHDLFMEWNVEDAGFLLCRPFRTKYSFINHSRDPNVCIEQESRERDPSRLTRRLVACKKIAQGDELTIDYRCEPLSDEYIAQATFL